MYLYSRHTMCMLTAVLSTLRCQASGRRLIPDSWNVSSAGPQDWPYCGDQCNPSGPDIFTGAFFQFIVPCSLPTCACVLGYS